MVKCHFPAEIEGARFVLRKHELKSAPTMFAAVERDRERLRQHLPWVDFTSTPDDEAAYIHMTHSQWDRFEVYDYSLFRKDDGVFMGCAGVHNISWLGATLEIGYWILGDFEGHGYITEASHALTSSAVELGFRRVEIRCQERNVRSARVPQRLGFRLVHRIPDPTAAVVHEPGYDTLVYAMSAEEWRNHSQLGFTVF